MPQRRYNQADGKHGELAAAALPQPAGEARGGGTGRCRLGDGPDDDDPGRAGREHLVQVGLVDAADGEPRPRRPQARRVPDQVQPGRGTAGLGRRRPYRPGAEVVGRRLGAGRQRLSRGVRGQPDQRARADELPRDRGGQVILAKVQHVGAAA